MTSKKCLPCEAGAQPLSTKEALYLLKKLAGWKLAADRNSIYVEWTMKDFAAAIQLVNKIAALAEQEGHHPDIHLTAYRKLKIVLSTHAIDGLSENDFILASKIDRLSRCHCERPEGAKQSRS
jgi:4a-hydroxytetrahydrobiopterin dehydratase